MDTHTAVTKLGALAHMHRLNAFRLLIETGPNGLAAGDLAAQLGLTGPNMSFHLRLLEKADLVQSSRDHRNVFYAVDVAGVRALLAYLSEDCCNGRPELCGIQVKAGGPTTAAVKSDRVFQGKAK
ncbi:transcriptional regulator [Hwanghaeella grinnelliae]|uniref:Transcriptional regulator n=1 Tax=Hwanghaeella grinnelliae TaxID=2500179 RepID=A0A437QH79_9PROT|nr:metalloregulator ArsR/SmtB family transcription factor [Hwanghaeella grinnelliae]RVU33872.1 transcriptional regulator [Hwanghaeella grinnelliae]